MTGHSGTEDLAGIAALTELVASRTDPAVPLAVPLSALVDGQRRNAGGHRTADGTELRPRILLVEDNPVNRLLVGVLLDRLGLDHVAVGCGEEAIYRFAREPFDAILLDVAMDGMAGLATAQAIRTLAGEDIPPLIALGRGDLGDDDLEVAGFSSVAEAPLDTGRLLVALISAVEKCIERPT